MMNLIKFTGLALLLFLLCQDVSRCHQYHVTVMPSAYAPCFKQPCFTLGQFAERVTEYSGSNSSVKLSLMPGNHTLASELIISNVLEFSMISASDTKVWILCEDATILSIVSVFSVSIGNLALLGCEGIKLTSVANFYVEECMFLSFNGNIAILEFNRSTVTITKSSFMASDNNISVYTSHPNNESDALNTMVISNTSNVSIHASTFTTKQGRALYAEESIINIRSVAFCNSTIPLLNKDLTLIKLLNTTIEFKDVAIMNNERHMIVFTKDSRVTISGSRISHNIGTFYTIKSNISIYNTTISENDGRFSVICLVKTYANITDGNFSNNTGSFLVRNSNVRFYRSYLFANCVQRESMMKVKHLQTEGTLTSIQSTVDFYGTVTFQENYSEKSGGGYPCFWK